MALAEPIGARGENSAAALNGQLGAAYALLVENKLQEALLEARAVAERNPHLHAAHYIAKAVPVPAVAAAGRGSHADAFTVG